MVRGIQVRPDYARVEQEGPFASPDPTHHWQLLHYNLKPLEESVLKFARGTGDTVRVHGRNYADGVVQEWVHRFVSGFDNNIIQQWNGYC